MKHPKRTSNIDLSRLIEEIELNKSPTDATQQMLCTFVQELLRVHLSFEETLDLIETLSEEVLLLQARLDLIENN